MNEATSQAPAPLLLNAWAASKALNVSERTLARLTAAGDIPVVRIGHRVLYDPRDLVAWIDRAKRKGREQDTEGSKAWT